MLFQQNQQAQYSDQFNKMANYIRINWGNCINAHASVLTQGMQYALQNYLNNTINQWAQMLCAQINQNPGAVNTSVIDNMILGWFNAALQSIKMNAGAYPAQNAFGQPITANPMMGGMGGGFGGMMRPQMGFNGMGMGMQAGGLGSVLEASNQMYGDEQPVQKTAKLPDPIIPMSNIPKQTDTLPVTKPVESIQNQAAQDFARFAFKMPSCDNRKEMVFKLPVSGKGYVETYHICQGKKLSKKLFIELDKFTDNIMGVLDKLKKKYDYDNIVIKYRSFELIDCNLADIQQVFLKIKELCNDEVSDFAEINKNIIKILDTKPKNITKQIESIVLKEYNDLVKHFGPDGCEADNLDSLLTEDKYEASYIKEACDLIQQTMVFDPASSDVASYLQDYEIGDDKTYKDLRKNKEKFAEWAKNHAVVVSHPKLLRYTRIFDAEPNVVDSIASGEFVINYEDDGSPLGSDFEYFLNDDITIDSSFETLLIKNGSSLYTVHLARMNQIDKTTDKTVKQVSLRND